MTIVFYDGDEQKKVAEESRDRVSKRLGQPIRTAIMPATVFSLAEDYHQKYWLRQHKELLQEYQAIYPDNKDFLKSTAVARVNAYLGGQGSLADLDKEIADLGLSANGQQRLRELVKARR